MTGRGLIMSTPRTRLSTWSSDDADDLAVLHGDPAVMAEMTSGIQTLDQTRTRIRTWIDQHTAHGWSTWRVTDPEDRLLGRAGFGVSHGTGHREIGYLLRRDAWGQGIATELVNSLVQWHLRHPDPTMSATLHGYVFRTNTASRHILSHAAFRPAGHDPHDPRQLLYVRDVAATFMGVHSAGRGRFANPGEHNTELIAAQARDGIGGTHESQQAARELFQH